MEGAVSLVHAMGWARLLRGGSTAWLWLALSITGYAASLAFIATTWRLGWQWTTLLVVLAAAMLHLFWFGLETPSHPGRPLLPVREIPRALLDGGFPWAIASLGAAALLCVAAQASDHSPAAIDDLPRALGLIPLAYPFTVVMYGTLTQDRAESKVRLAVPTLALVVAVALGWTDTLAGELTTAAALLVLVLATKHSQLPSWLTTRLAGVAGASGGATHRAARPAELILRSDLLRGLLRLGLPAAAISAVCWFLMGWLGVGILDGAASFLLIVIAMMAQILAMVIWPWLPMDQPQAGWEAHNLLPLQSASLERTALRHLAAMACLFIAFGTTSIGLLAACADTPPIEVLDDLVLLAPVLPPMGWLVIFSWRFHRSRHHLAALAAAGLVFWFAWLAAGLTSMEQLAGLLSSTSAGPPSQTLALGAIQLALLALFVGAVQLLRLLWLRPERRSP